MWQIYFEVLAVMLSMACFTWVVSVKLKNVSIVDSLWSLMFFAGAIYILLNSAEVAIKTWFIFFLLSLWAWRLSIFLAVRNLGETEDRRYREIRENNSPNFAIKSLFIVFLLQAFLAWLIFIGLLPGFYQQSQFRSLDLLGLLLWITGFLFELVADFQLYMFKKQATKQAQVLDSGLWRYTRHPNYFGEFLVWWGFFLMLVTVETWWVITAPVIMTFLLLKISGVGLMEKDITDRRPAYRRYMQSTNAFFPWRPSPLRQTAGDPQ